MKNYVEIKIMKRTLIIIGIILLLVFGMGIGYIWCSYHPTI